MTRHRQIVLATVLVAAALVGGLAVVVRAQSVDGAVSRAESSVPPRGLTSSPVPEPEPTITTVGPPKSKVPGPSAVTAHLADRYRARYQGTYVTWDELLENGARLPEVSRGCRSAWRSATRDATLDWARANYLCLDGLVGDGFKPQGIGGSGSTAGYRIGDRAAEDRNIVIVSSYSSKRHPGLLFPNRPGETETTRLTVIDVDRRRYNTVELVKPGGASTFTALDSHGSGLAWAGQYLYSSSRGSLWMYNADDLLRIEGRYVLPAVASWRVTGQGGLSSIGIDRSSDPIELTGINYTESGTTWSHSFELDPTGQLQRGAKAAKHELELTSLSGPGTAAVRSSRSAVVPGTNYQGIGASGPYSFANSSSLMLQGTRHGDSLVVLKKSKPIARFVMPSENIESVYVDHRRSRYVTVTEHGEKFLFWLPLDHLIDRAER